MTRALFGKTSGLIVLLVAGLLNGCATPPPASDPEALADFRANNDPLEPTNRVLYAIHNGLDWTSPSYGPRRMPTARYCPSECGTACTMP